MTALLFSAGGCPSYPFYSFERGPWYPFFFVASDISGWQNGGRWKGATSKNVKNRQKASKSFSTLFDNFRAGQKTSKIVKKVSKSFSTLFGNFRAAPFFRPLLQSADDRKPFQGKSPLKTTRVRAPERGTPRPTNKWMLSDSQFRGLKLQVSGVFELPSTPKCLQYKKILRGINFVKITKNIFSSVELGCGHSCLLSVQYPRRNEFP